MNPKIIRNFRSYKNFKFLQYQDSILSIFLAKNLYETNQEALSPISSFCSPLRLHGVFIRSFILLFMKLFTFLERNSDKLDQNKNMIQIKIKSALCGQITSIFVASFIVCYVFRRLISIFRICDYKTQNEKSVKSYITTTPFMLTILLAVLPSRFAFLRSCATSDSLFFALICFTFIFYNVSSYLSTFLFIIFYSAALMTRFEGIILIPIFFIISVSKLFFFLINKLRKKSKIQEFQPNESNKTKENSNKDKKETTKVLEDDQNTNKDKKENNIKENNENDSNSENSKIDDVKHSDIEKDSFDDESGKVLISLIVKLISIVALTLAYHWIFMNFGERPFTFEDFISHLIFPYQMSNEKPDKNKNAGLVSYPFQVLVNYVGTINNLRQSHALFSAFIPLLFSAALFITADSSSPSKTVKKEEIKSQSNPEPDLKAKTQSKPKEEKNRPNSNINKKSAKSNRTNSNKNNSIEQNQIKKPVENQTKNQEEVNEFTIHPFSPCYHEITADFMRQLGLFILAFSVSASCVTNGGIYRILVTAQAFAYPIVAERLISHFLQLLLSTTSFINSSENTNVKDDKKLKRIALSEKFVFICGSLVLFVSLITWDCLYARREIQRYLFSSNSWYNFVIK